MDTKRKVFVITPGNFPSKPYLADSKPPTFEEILEELGCFGRFQALTLFLYSFLEIAAAFVVFIPIVAARNVSPAKCEQNISNIKVTKSFTDDFQAIIKNPFQFESLIDEWDLKCDRAWISYVFTSCLMAGMIVGSLLWSQVADWYGRRVAFLNILLLMLFGTLLSAFSPSIYFYATSRLICGVAYSGYMTISCMSVIEFMTPKWRSLANVVGTLGEGVMILALLGYYIRPWRQLYLATLPPYLLIIPVYFFLPESPRWLLRNRRVAEAHKVLCFMAKLNKTPAIPIEVLYSIQKQEEAEISSQSKKRLSYLDFIRTKHLCTMATFMFAIFFSWNIGYYGVSYNIRNVPGNIYLNLALIGLANAIGQRSSWLACNKFGRRRAVLYCMTLSAVFLVGVAICFLTMKAVKPEIILIACFISLFGLSSTRASLRLLSGESFPTAVRNMGLAMGGIGANIAGLLTPQTAYLGSKSPSLPFFIFAIVSVLGSFVVFMMKETTGKPLSDEVDQVKNEKCKKPENQI